LIYIFNVHRLKNYRKCYLIFPGDVPYCRDGRIAATWTQLDRYVIFVTQHRKTHNISQFYKCIFVLIKTSTSFSIQNSLKCLNINIFNVHWLINYRKYYLNFPEDDPTEEMEELQLLGRRRRMTWDKFSYISFPF